MHHLRPHVKPFSAPRSGHRPGNNAPMPARPKAAPLTHADVVVLALLARRPTHGYELVTELERHAEGGRAPVSRAQIYYSLKKLLRAGLILSTPDKSAPVGPEREPCRLSAAGRRAMSAALSSPQWATERPPIPFHTWLMVLGQADPADRAAALRLRRDHLAARMDEESRALARLRAENDPVPIAVATHRLQVLRMERDLLTAVEPMLGQP